MLGLTNLPLKDKEEAVERQKLGLARKMLDAKEVMRVLEAKSSAVQKLLDMRKPPPPPEEVKEQPPSTKKRKTSSLVPQPRHRTAVDPKSFVGRRVAKHFPVDGEMPLFFGTVKGYSASECWWQIVYDDGDGEDLDKDDLLVVLGAYEKNKKDDPRTKL